MASEHDAGVVEQVRRTRPSVRVEADDPQAVGLALADVTGARIVPAADAPTWAAEARQLRVLAERVRAAEQVVAGARAAEQARDDALVAAVPVASTAEAEPPAEATPARSPVDEAAADRQALRFALVILVLAQAAGTVVYVVDGELLAVAAPAAALALVAGIVIAHRGPLPRRRRLARAAREPVERSAAVVVEPVGPPGSPAIRTAEAHLRRQQAAWKLAWWQRGLAPTAVADWTRPPAGGATSATLVVVDEAGELDEQVHATMAAAVPAAVRVVLVVPRASGPAAD